MYLQFTLQKNKFFTQLSKLNIPLIFILLISAFLLFWKLESGMVFIGDFAWYFLQARDYLLGGRFPLVGIPSSVPIIRQGAVWSWVLAIALKLGNFNPVSGAYAVSLINLVAIYFSYSVTKEIYDKKVALLNSLFLATSPLVVIHSRLPFQTALIFPASLLLTWFYIKAEKTRFSKYLFLLGLSLSLILQIYLGAFILFLVIHFSIFISWKKYTLKNLIYIAGGIILGLLPFIFWDLQQGVYIQTLGFLAWFFSKIIEIIPNFVTGQVKTDYSTILTPFKNLYFPQFLLIAIILFSFSVIRYISVLKHNVKDPFYVFIVLWLLLGLFGLVGRGLIIEAYLPLLFYPLSLILTLFLMYLIQKSKWFIVIPILISLTNIWYLTIKDPLFKSKYRSTYERDLKISAYLVNDTKSREFQLDYITKTPYFESSDDHYEYIIWWKGGKDVYNSDLKYQLISELGKPSEGFEVVGKYGDLILTKNKND